jgi:SNF2 family DNA or RNA helicase
MTSLKPAQIKLIEHGLANPYSILAGDTGTGKTRAAIEIRNKVKMKCLVICPSYQVFNWVDEIAKWGNNNTVLPIKASKDVTGNFNTDYIVVSYDIAKKHECLFEWAEMIVMDECHLLKSVKAKRTQMIHKYIYENSIPRVHPMSGTVIKNRVEEYYSNLALMCYDPKNPDVVFLDKFPDNVSFADHFSFRHEYQIEVGNRLVTIVKWGGIKNVDELKKWLRGKYVRAKADRKENTIYKDIKISNVDDPKLLEAFNSWIENGDSGGVDPTAKAEAALNKVPITVQYVKDLLDEAQSVVVFSDHVASSEAIAKEFDTIAMNHHVGPHSRMEYAKKFQSGEGRVLVISRALSEGVTLTRSNHIVFNDYPWVPGDVKQVIARIDRLGQEKTCIVHRIILSPQDEYIMNVIQDKIKVIDKVT